jgi:hypothetical protein
MAAVLLPEVTFDWELRAGKGGALDITRDVKCGGAIHFRILRAVQRYFLSNQDLEEPLCGIVCYS